MESVAYQHLLHPDSLRSQIVPASVDEPATHSACFDPLAPRFSSHLPYKNKVLSQQNICDSGPLCCTASKFIRSATVVNKNDTVPSTCGEAVLCIMHIHTKRRARLAQRHTSRLETTSSTTLYSSCSLCIACNGTITDQLGPRDHALSHTFQNF